MMNFLMNQYLWIGMMIFFLLCVIGLSIFFYLLYKKTHMMVELKAFFTNTPISIFFQDNRFAEWKAITPVNGIIYDKYYGPFIVSATYVDKRTKNIIMPFDVDMDGDRTTKVKDIVNEFQNITTNDRTISLLRTQIAGEDIPPTPNILKLTSDIKFSSLKKVFFSSVPHNIKSKIEKIVAERVKRHGNVNHMQAIIVFGAIFGLIVIASMLLKIMGVV